LALAASVTLILAILISRQRTAALPGIILAAFFLAFALFGASAWNWSRDQNGAGLPGQIPATAGFDTIGVNAFASAALGAALAALVGAAVSKQSFSLSSIFGKLSQPRLGTYTQLASLVALILWLVGQGTNLWLRQNYMDTNGSQAFLTTFSLIGPLVGISALLIGTLSGVRATRVASWALGASWWGLTSAVGTRVAVGFVLTAVLACVIYFFRHRSIASRLVTFIELIVFSYATLATFAVTYVARGTTHGLSRLAGLFASESVPRPFDIATWIPALKWLTSSIFASFPLTEQSALRAPPASIIIANLNPLPASLLNIDPYTFERLWPWMWVPLGFVGEVYGAFGPMVEAGLFFCIALSAGVGAAWLQKKHLDVAVVLVLVMVVALGFLAIQYPSRSAGRIISFVVIGPYLGAAVVGVLKLFRVPRMTDHFDRKRRTEQPISAGKGEGSSPHRGRRSKSSQGEISEGPAPVTTRHRHST